jgi:FAD/FMN-containing dehydrogenase
MHASFAETTLSPAIDPLALAALRGALQGRLYTPEDQNYQANSTPWQLHVAQRPAAVVMAAGAEDVVAAVNFAREHGLPVAVQATGHGAVVPCDGAVLINTSLIQGVAVDAAARTAWVAGGSKWGPVLAAAQDAGLAPLLGSTTDVGVVGYSLGGGMGWLARKHGLAVDSIRAFDIVTADGQLRHVDAGSEPELFWGVRGGAGNFGVVTSVELDLYPVTEVYAGNLFFPMSMARAVLGAYREWIATLPDEWTTSISLAHLPPLPFLPEPLRGRSVVIVRGCYAGPAAEGEAWLRPMRALSGMIADVFGPMPFRAADLISQDPVEPMNGFGRTETLADLSPETIEALATLMERSAGSPLMFIEVRHLGGAVARPAARPSAFAHRDMQFVMLMAGAVFDPRMDAAAQQYLQAAAESLASHKTGQVYLNFLHDTDTTAERVRAGYTAETYARLVALKDQYDPANMFRFNRNIPPCGFGGL